MKSPDDTQSIITTFLSHLGVHSSHVGLTEERGHPVYHITTGDAALLIGNNGENLRALTHLLKRVAEKQLGDKFRPFLVDVNGYQKKKFEDIERQAFVLARRACTYQTNVEMNPMNAYERMLVHNLFKDDPRISTESVGEGKQRRIVLTYNAPAKKEALFDVNI